MDFGNRTATVYFSHVLDQTIFLLNGNKIIIDAILLSKIAVKIIHLRREKQISYLDVRIEVSITVTISS
jgi:hypothetical protein